MSVMIILYAAKLHLSGGRVVLAKQHNVKSKKLNPMMRNDQNKEKTLKRLVT